MNEGEIISLDGNEGDVFAGTLELVTETPDRELGAIAFWRRAATA